MNRPAELVQNAPIYKEANEEISLGTLPKGAIVTLLGEEKEGYVFVEVALSDGEELGGWVREEALKRVKKFRKKDRYVKVTLPRDERLLIKRLQTYMFAVSVGSSLGILTTEANDFTYSGFGLLAGIQGGYFLSSHIHLRGELNYLQTKGSQSEDTTVTPSLDFGFLELGVVAAYRPLPFELFGGFQYAIGLSIQDDPTGTLTSASDLSHLWAQVGGGIQIPLEQYLVLWFKGRYAVAFTRSPYSFHTFGLMASLELQL